MAYLYSDLVTDFRDIMRDPSSLNNKFFTDAEILRWAVDGNMELVREAGLLLFQTNLALTVFDGDVYDSNALTAGVAYTSIVVDQQTCVPPHSGRLTIVNSAGASQTFDYTSWSLGSSRYTFTINSTTALYSFAANDTVTIYKSQYSFPTSVLKIVSVVDGSNQRIYPTTINTLDEYNDSWRDESGTPQWYYPTLEKGTASENPDIGFYPAPSAAANVVIRAWKLPASSSAAAATAATATPELDEVLTKLILDYCLAMGFRKKRDFTQAENATTRFYKHNLKMAKNYFNRELDLMPGLRSNEGVGVATNGRYPDGYPRFER
jgi:hypothetical protein